MSWEKMLEQDAGQNAHDDEWVFDVSKAGTVWTMISCKPQRDGHRNAAGKWVWDGIRERGKTAQCEVLLSAGDGVGRASMIKVSRWLTEDQADALRAAQGRPGAITVQGAAIRPYCMSRGDASGNVHTSYGMTLQGDILPVSE